MQNSANQHWLLLGTAPASEEVWGLRRIEFPCGYFIPEIAFAPSGYALELPETSTDVWALGGFALEIGRGGKHIPKNVSAKHVSGYRPWLGFYYPALLDELDRRKHTVMVWDRGVSIFYGMWRENCQALGELVEPAEFAENLSRHPVRLELDSGVSEGSAAVDYAHGADSIVSFMSEFMTLSAGDVYVQGPLAARKITANDKRAALVVDKFHFEIALRKSV